MQGIPRSPVGNSSGTFKNQTREATFSMRLVELDTLLAKPGPTTAQDIQAIKDLFPYVLTLKKTYGASTNNALHKMTGKIIDKVRTSENPNSWHLLRGALEDLNDDTTSYGRCSPLSLRGRILTPQMRTELEALLNRPQPSVQEQPDHAHRLMVPVHVYNPEPIADGRDDSDSESLSNRPQIPIQEQQNNPAELADADEDCDIDPRLSPALLEDFLNITQDAEAAMKEAQIKVTTWRPENGEASPGLEDIARHALETVHQAFVSLAVMDDLSVSAEVMELILNIMNALNRKDAVYESLAAVKAMNDAFVDAQTAPNDPKLRLVEAAKWGMIALKVNQLADEQDFSSQDVEKAVEEILNTFNPIRDIDNASPTFFSQETTRS